MISSIENLHDDIVKKLVGLFFDIDGTLTIHGKLHSTPFKALWALKESGFKAVPITGRSAGWCDHIARMWPVDAVVGENGALYFWFDENEGKLKRRFFDSHSVRANKQRRLKRICKEILSSVTGTAVASDQRYRETDLAIDYSEDVGPLEQRNVDLICDIFEKHSATFKASSIHVNGWFGDYDKLKMTKILVKEQWDMELDANKGFFLFCGDSPNDEPMFKYFPFSVGVKNVLHFTDRMTHLPAFVTNREGGEGFVEMVNILLSRARC